MIWAIAVLSLIVWVFVMVATATATGLIHLLLLPVVVAAVVHIVQSRKALA